MYDFLIIDFHFRTVCDIIIGKLIFVTCLSQSCKMESTCSGNLSHKLRKDFYTSFVGYISNQIVGAHYPQTGKHYTFFFLQCKNELTTALISYSDFMINENLCRKF